MDGFVGVGWLGTKVGFVEVVEMERKQRAANNDGKRK